MNGGAQDSGAGMRWTSHLGAMLVSIGLAIMVAVSHQMSREFQIIVGAAVGGLPTLLFYLGYALGGRR